MYRIKVYKLYYIQQLTGVLGSNSLKSTIKSRANVVFSEEDQINLYLVLAKTHIFFSAKTIGFSTIVLYLLVVASFASFVLKRLRPNKLKSLWQKKKIVITIILASETILKIRKHKSSSTSSPRRGGFKSAPEQWHYACGEHCIMFYHYEHHKRLCEQ